MMRGNLGLIAGMAVLAATTATAAAPKAKAPPPAAARPVVQGCEQHRFETVIHMTGSDGLLKESKVRMCGTPGESDADWIRTLKDAVRKTSENPQMPPAAKDQIIAAVNAEIDRLSLPSLQLPAGTDIAKLPGSAATSTPDVPLSREYGSLPPLPTKPVARAATDVPLSRDYGSLPPLPTASNVAPPHVLGPGAVMTPAPRLTLRCALAGDEDRPGECDGIDKDTILVLRADEAFPHGVAMRFVRHGDQRAELDLPAMKQGDKTNLRLPAAVCTGVVRSKLEIQALGANAPNGAAAGTIGEYDLHC
jgi:hypothetical protein